MRQRTAAEPKFARRAVRYDVDRCQVLKAVRRERVDDLPQPLVQAIEHE